MIIWFENGRVPRALLETAMRYVEDGAASFLLGFQAKAWWWLYLRGSCLLWTRWHQFYKDHRATVKTQGCWDTAGVWDSDQHPSWHCQSLNPHKKYQSYPCIPLSSQLDRGMLALFPACAGKRGKCRRVNGRAGQTVCERKAVQSGHVRARQGPAAKGTVLPASAWEE